MAWGRAPARRGDRFGRQRAARGASEGPPLQHSPSARPSLPSGAAGCSPSKRSSPAASRRTAATSSAPWFPTPPASKDRARQQVVPGKLGACRARSATAGRGAGPLQRLPGAAVRVQARALRPRQARGAPSAPENAPRGRSGAHGGGNLLGAPRPGGTTGLSRPSRASPAIPTTNLGHIAGSAKQHATVPVALPGATVGGTRRLPTARPPASPAHGAAARRPSHPWGWARA